MSVLMRCSEIIKRPVITMDGEDVAQVKDVVYGADGGEVAGFTLAGRGILAGPLDRSVVWNSVAALGSDAIMIADEDALTPIEDLLGTTSSRRGSGSDVLGAEVLTDTGTALGEVVDVIVEVDTENRCCDVVGYEIVSSEALGHKGTKVLIPLPDTLSASGDHLLVPADATAFVRDDLAGFGAAVDAFRQQLKGHH
ncbi:PRC-barrel domain-containing protein [Rhodococcus sp. IEGM 1318]|uniref:PRC-barrel domain-containing protein n=1 Tax=Rhodococcus sp. IEGM 1318 TaxID=3082226 RepID=UPI0029559FC3|nr:PRC-barrel domain-containing protein [Rhodococcus sp. IEGM 1318]MDV8009513.1 PRC-barrel domain-containing protein [Rhodococcus sp. IEGM 1318]